MSGSRIAAAREWASGVKVAVTISAVAAFLAVMVLARVTQAGGGSRARALSPPHSLQASVGAGSLSAGSIAPAQAAPSASSGGS